MKLLSVFRKGLREQRRDLLGLGLTLSCAPFFVFLYWLFFPAGSTTYGVLVLNKDTGDVVYELATLLLLTVVYFGAGVWLFRRTRLARA